MEYNAADIIRIVINQAQANGNTIAQQLKINRIMHHAEKPTSDKDDLDFLSAVLDGEIEGHSTILRQLHERTLGFKTELVYAMIDTLNLALKQWLEFWSMVEAIEIMEQTQNNNQDIGNELNWATLNENEMLQDAPDIYFWVLEDLKKQIGLDGVELTHNETRLPSELDNDRARKYFARAIELGYMERTDTGYKWNKQQIRLGYFCLKVYSQPRPIKALETLFGVNKLDSSITQASYEPIRADVKKWRTEMDNDIFFD